MYAFAVPWTTIYDVHSTGMDNAKGPYFKAFSAIRKAEVAPS
jgi:hypothetical protein